MIKAYGALSKVYEYLILDSDYNLWAEYIVSHLNALGVKRGASGIDCACGSGFFTRALKKAGLDVLGVDLSQEMLTEAKNLSQKEGLNIQYLQMNIVNLKSFKKVDFLTVINDAINYIEPKDIFKTFKSFYSSLNSQGVLVFDISSEYKIKNILGNNLFGEDTEECSYMWFNQQGDGFVDMDIVLFLKEGDKYVKKEESHRQFSHNLDFILENLEKAGFKDISYTAHLGKELKSDSDRIIFSAKKV